jgi:hypothetical protein
LGIDYGFIAALFGMTTYHSLKTQGGKVEEPPKKEDTKEEIPDEPSEN